MYIKRFKRNLLGSDYVIGDLHGHIKLLYKHLEEIKFNPEIDRLFAVGDLIDRGPDNEMVIDLIYKSWFHSVKGNHEDMAVLVAENPTPIDNSANGAAWFCCLPKQEQLEYASHFNELPLVIEVDTPKGKIGILHADTYFDDWDIFVKEIEAEKISTIHNTLWNTKRYYEKKRKKVKNIYKIYVGHLTVKKSIILGNVVYCDTNIHMNQCIDLIKIN